MLFGFDQYYPLGGANDWQGSFENVEDAWAYALNPPNIWQRRDRYHILDFQTGLVLSSLNGEWHTVLEEPNGGN
jgi:hypothetical protein